MAPGGTERVRTGTRLAWGRVRVGARRVSHGARQMPGSGPRRSAFWHLLAFPPRLGETNGDGLLAALDGLAASAAIQRTFLAPVHGPAHILGSSSRITPCHIALPSLVSRECETCICDRKFRANAAGGVL